jgi:hypothetical protein
MNKASGASPKFVSSGPRQNLAVESIAEGGSIHSIQPPSAIVQPPESSRCSNSNELLGSITSFKSKLVCALAFCLSLAGDPVIEKAFEDIYQSGKWNADGFSLGNSEYKVNELYVKFLQNFMLEHHIQSVVDVGCGDWQFSRHIDWSGIDYKGYDVVRYVIDRNSALYSLPNVTFIHANVAEVDLPEADLVICKDVFQHLPNEIILKLLTKFQKFKHCLLTDYVNPGPFTLNGPISIGAYRPVDLTKPPFNVEGSVVFKFQARGLVKQVVYVSR